MDFIYQIAVALLVSGAMYGGVRADLKNLRESVSRAHERIDDILERDRW